MKILRALEERGREVAAQSKASKVWVAAMVASVLSALVLCLVLVWLNVERLDIGYSLKKMRQELADKEDARAKLEVERDHLLMPEVLDRKARAMGLSNAQPGQIRRME